MWHLPLSLTEINHFPVDFPWEIQEKGGLFNNCLDALSPSKWWHKKVAMTKWKQPNISAQHRSNILRLHGQMFSVTLKSNWQQLWWIKKTTRTRKIKLQDFEVLFTYTVQTFTLYSLLKCNLQTLAAILHRLLIYIIIRHFRTSFTSLSTFSFILFSFFLIFFYICTLFVEYCQT